MTFSIVAASGDELGVAVASKFLAVGSVVPWARAGAGAVATQAYANPTLGPRGLDLMGAGRPARDALDALLAEDAGRAKRQAGMVDARGRSATFTGPECPAWAGGRKGKGYACQGNILAGPRVVDAMAETFESTEGDLAARLLAALRAGDEAGGDARGRQSAALLVAKPKGGYGAAEWGWDHDRMIDLRADDDPAPTDRLSDMLALWRLYFTRPQGPGVPLKGRVKADVSRALRRLGGLGPREALTTEKLHAFLGRENFEERILPGGRVDAEVLTWLRAKAARGGPKAHARGSGDHSR